MGDKKKILTITLCSTLIGIPAVAGITVGIVSLTKARKEQEKKVETINIVNDIEPLETEQGKTIESKTIEVQCFNSKKQQIQSETKLSLFDKTFNKSEYDWISIIDNKIVISENADVGAYIFYVQASSVSDESVQSEFKQFEVVVKLKPEPEPTVVIDKITLDDVSDVTMYQYETHSTTFTVRAWQQDKEVTSYLPSLVWSATCIDVSPSGQEAPLCSQTYPTTNTCDVKLESNLHSGPEGFYNLIVSVKCIVDGKELSAEKTILVHVISGIKFVDENNYVYTRSKTTDPWTFTAVPVGTTVIQNVPDTIWDYPVTFVANNFSKNNNVKSTLTKVNLQNYITNIGKNAFEDCTSLQYIQGKNVMYVGDSAFAGCGLMQFVGSLPKFIEIGDNAFYSCESLKYVDLSGAKKIGSQAFFNTGIVNLELSDGLTAILMNTFANCKSLKTVKVYPLVPPTVEGLLFKDCDKLEEIYVPLECYSNYCSAPGWSTYSSIIKTMN